MPSADFFAAMTPLRRAQSGIPGRNADLPRRDPPPTPFMTYIATNAGAPLSTFAESLIKLLRQEAKAAAA